MPVSVYSLLGLLSIFVALDASGNSTFVPERGDFAPGAKLQRSLSLMATSTQEHRKTVRVLFYGQSITRQWAGPIEQHLRQTYPTANFVFGHLAIGGFSADRLVKIAPTDVNAFYPDLMLFHDYTSDPVPYEEIIRQTLANTATDILITSDHLLKESDIKEEVRPSELIPKNKVSWHNDVFLPDLAEKYGLEFVDIRSGWRQYLQQNDASPKILLRDNVHLNDRGIELATELIKGHLSFKPEYADLSDADRRVKTHFVGGNLVWKNNRLELEFEGNRIDIISVTGAKNTAVAQVFIDGKRPSSFPELTVFSRTSCYPKTWWPAIIRLGSNSPRVPEDWTLRIFDATDDLTRFKFEVGGSVTGPDGEGSNDARFVSKSGRVTISPEDWHLVFARSVSKQPMPDGFKITWRAVPYYHDEFHGAVGQGSAALESSTTIAQGLPSGKHRLLLVAPLGKEPPAILAIRIYCPQLL